MRRRSAEGLGFLAIVACVLLAGRDAQVVAPPAQPIATTDRALPPVVEPEPPPPPPPVVVQYVGNTNTHRFHALSCRYATCPNCRAKFATWQEAIDEGYRACGICNP
jgi:hypothetical protein